MAQSYEWTEWHLTPQGWEKGTIMRDGFPNPHQVQPPSDRLVTYRYSEIIYSTEEFMNRGFEKPIKLVWQSNNDDNYIKQYLDKYGSPPESL